MEDRAPKVESERELQALTDSWGSLIEFQDEGMIESCETAIKDAIFFHYPACTAFFDRVARVISISSKYGFIADYRANEL